MSCFVKCSKMLFSEMLRFFLILCFENVVLLNAVFHEMCFVNCHVVGNGVFSEMCFVKCRIF